MTTDPIQPDAEAEPLPIVLCLGELRMELHPGQRYVLGSGEKATLKVNHGTVSREHAELEVADFAVRVRDLNSTNGTWVAGARVDAAEIGLGTEFKIGDVPAKFEQFLPEGTAAESAAAAVHSRYRDPSFNELMAEHLRRAPWFAISIVMHLIVLLILQLIIAAQDPLEERRIVMSIAEPEGVEDIVDDEAEEEVVVEESVDDIVLPEVDNNSEFDEPSQSAEMEFDPSETFDPMIGSDWMSSLKGGGSGDILDDLGRGGDNDGFKKKISGLRKYGIDIVFVFDSTESMYRPLEETTRRISLMVDVLDALIEGSRIGIITYRDHGDYEEYLTREVPLTDDYYRSMNFMQTVRANGGADFPEAVFDALKSATRLKWRKHAQRVMVLIGDAPGHEKNERRIRDLARGFARKNQSFVHTIMVPYRGEIESTTRQNFEMIADAGGGACIPLDNADKILRDVLSLAIGQAHRRSINNAFEIVKKKRSRISAKSRDMVKRKDLEGIRKAMKDYKIDDDLVKALCESRDYVIAAELIKMLSSPKTSKRARQACAYALQRILELEMPPIDPETEAHIDRRWSRELLARARKRLRA